MIASASADDYRRALACLLDDPNVDSVVVLFIDTGAAAEAVAKAIKQGRKEAQTGREKPLVASFMSEVGGASRWWTRRRPSPPTGSPSRWPGRWPRRCSTPSGARSRPGRSPYFDDMDLEAAKAVCEEALSRRGEGWLRPDEVDRCCRRRASPRSRPASA